MKHYFLIISLVLFLNNVSNGQNSNDFFFDEFQISLNRSCLQNNNTEDRFGFGLGAYHSFLPDKKINLVFGLEYNRISQFKKRMYEGHFSHATDLTYNLNCFSIPVGLRLNIGSKTKLFIETGGFADLYFMQIELGLCTHICLAKIIRLITPKQKLIRKWDCHTLLEFLLDSAFVFQYQDLN